MGVKLEIIKNRLKDFESAVIAFSGGVDSTFLAKAAKDIKINLFLYADFAGKLKAIIFNLLVLTD